MKKGRLNTNSTMAFNITNKYFFTQIKFAELITRRVFCHLTRVDKPWSERGSMDKALISFIDCEEFLLYVENIPRTHSRWVDLAW
jgi:hypothetical protein